jgi:hypothetical protein
MARSRSTAALLAERLCRPQHLGVFGHRSVGKTTLLTLLYREAVGGRLPGLRLAASDARTAGYLAEKILQIEQGVPLPATLAETDLRFSLYTPAARLELVVKDYQGEHVTLGRDEPIREFLRDCDVVWLCLDVPTLGARADNLTAEMEVQQVVEDYLSTEPGGENARPMALVLTKSDQLPRTGKLEREVLADRLPMTRTALEQHSPHHALLAVSSLGGPLTPGGTLVPRGFEELLEWLLRALQAQDEARMERLFALAGGDVALLERCVTCFARRYPEADSTATYKRRLARVRRTAWRRRLAAVAATLLGLFTGLYAYDALGSRAARQFEAENPRDMQGIVSRWQTFQAWHPTWAYISPAAARTEREHLRQLEVDLRAEQLRARVEEVQRGADDPDADMEKVWALYRAIQADYPDADLDSATLSFRDKLRQRRDGERERRADRAFQELVAAEVREDTPALVARAEAFLREHPGTRRAREVTDRMRGYIAGVDDREFESARVYRARQPINFHTQRENFLRYLEKHPDGHHSSEARQALVTIETDWDRHDYKAVRDLFVAKPGAVRDLESLSRAYLSSHAQGRYREPVQEVLRWLERVTVRQGYKVRLKSGSLDKGTVMTLSRGMNPSIEIEVNGVVYGPSTIASRTSDPEWDYEFPRPIRWKLGDQVVIRITDHYFWNRAIGQIASAEDDPVGMVLLSGTAASGKNTLIFESDFTMPKLPAVE